MGRPGHRRREEGAQSPGQRLRRATEESGSPGRGTHETVTRAEGAGRRGGRTARLPLWMCPAPERCRGRPNTQHGPMMPSARMDPQLLSAHVQPA